MASRRSQFYTEDDLDDGYDSEEDWYGDEEEEEDDQPVQAPPKVGQTVGLGKCSGLLTDACLGLKNVTTPHVHIS